MHPGIFRSPEIFECSKRDLCAVEQTEENDARRH